MIYAMAAVAMMAVGCQKDRNADGMLLLAEGFNNNGSKVLVDGLTSTWADGDEVRINDQTATVSVTTGNASVHLGSGVDAPFYGVYPAGIYGSNSGASYTLNLPATYTYETDGTYQKLASPMVGYTDNSTSMTFKHLTAAVTVQIKNDFGIDVTVTNVTVSSNKYKLNGTTAVTLGNSIAVAAEETDNAALRQVQMNFTGTALNITSGNSANVQVPVFPVGNDNRFTISVTVQNKDDAEMVYTFNKTQGSTQDTYALGRAELGYAPAKFGGVFTINASGDQVRFAPGNLQYQASSTTWRFAKHQYDAIGNNAGNNVFDDTRSTQAAWIDLFGWGTSGWNGGSGTATIYYQPYDYLGTGSSGYGYYYGPSTGTSWSPTCTYSLTGDYANRDWGVYNAIINGGNMANQWRTLTGGSGAEWEYIMSTRSASTVSGVSNARYLKAKVANVNGYIIFPDEFVLPDGVSITSSHINFNTYLGWASVTSVLSSSDWAKMEVAGAIFLPCTGYRSYSSNNPSFTADAGYYWSSTVNSASNAYHIQLQSGSPSFTANNAKRLGCSVRLVRDVQ